MTAAEREQVPATPGAAVPMLPPIHLSDLAQLLFGQIVAQLEAERRADARYVQQVALLAIRLEQVQRWQAVLETCGDTYEATTTTGSVMIRARPEVAMLSDAMRQAQSLLGELMLNPVAALRIASGKGDGPGDWDDF
ncbi:P27 family phage terminase small subunit [Sphingomonas sp. VNH70]|uniref:P27 family phage terminase small subunit n=1 Tax=Sphingomonas silueang TaxID=3156617 RepID=UPI0032B40ED9